MEQAIRQPILHTYPLRNVQARRIRWLKTNDIVYGIFLIFMNNNERKQQRYLRRKNKREQKRTAQNAPYDNFNALINPDNLLLSFKLCKKGVAWKHSVQMYEQDLIKNIAEAIKELKAGRLVTKGFKCFKINERGKIRNIKSPHISERVVQKTLCDKCITPILSRALIYDNGASIENKGTSFSRKRLIKQMAEYYRRYGGVGYALVIDYSKYFDNIDHETLYKMADKYITDPQLRSIYHQAVDEFGNTGLGLGSQVSQTLAIFYPNKIDHYIKEILRIKYYGRYMDDSYLLSPDKKYLQNCLEKIKGLCAKYKIKINPRKTRIINIKDGIPFLHCRYRYTKTGHVIKSGGRESAKRMRRKLKYFKRQLDAGRMTIKDIRDIYQSWRGFMRQFDDRMILRNVDTLYNELFL